MGKNWDHLKRVLDNWGWFGSGYFFPKELLAAIAIRESGADPNAVEKGGNGRGLMQIDVGQHPQYKDHPQLFDPNWSVSTGINIMRAEENNLKRAGFSGVSLTLALLHVYNAGYPSKKLINSTNPADFDATNPRNKDYVSSILNIAKYCFGYSG